MERFLGEIAREKPIRFAPQQLTGFTQNFSKVLGSGGFGVVYEGQFPNGVLIAVKVLNNSSVSIVLGTIVTVAIVVAVIYCLKRATKSILSYYAPVTIGQSDQAANGRGQSKDYYGAADAAFPVIRDSQLEAGTMERFLGEIAREKPIRFAPQQLAGFTRDFSKVLGSGGFGVVYEGQFPNGVLIAVKVLNNSSGTSCNND